MTVNGTHTHRFWLWQTIRHDGVVTHTGTCPIGWDIAPQAARSDKTHPAGAPHTVRYQEVERTHLITTNYGEWVTL